jgi:hypothetical protein
MLYAEMAGAELSKNYNYQKKPQEFFCSFLFVVESTA